MSLDQIAQMHDHNGSLALLLVETIYISVRQSVLNITSEY